MESVTMVLYLSCDRICLAIWRPIYTSTLGLFEWYFFALSPSNYPIASFDQEIKVRREWRPKNLLFKYASFFEILSVDFAAYLETLFCMKTRSGFSVNQLWIKGIFEGSISCVQAKRGKSIRLIICSRYENWLIDLQFFSQNKSGSFMKPLKHF